MCLILCLLTINKFDVRLYLLIKGIDKLEAYISYEGIARFCTEEYSDPKKLFKKMDDKDPKLYSHLTNYHLNKENEKYVTNKDFVNNNEDGSKRLLSAIFKSFEEKGVDVGPIKEQIKDISTKIVLAFQPILINSFHNEIGINKECNKN